MHNFLNWFDNKDIETPYRVQYRYKDIDGIVYKGVVRFETKADAERFYFNLPEGSRKILSQRLFGTQRTKYLKYEYGN